LHVISSKDLQAAHDKAADDNVVPIKAHGGTAALCKTS